MTTLDELAVRYGTDKSTLCHGYTRWYERLFEPIRDLPLDVLELGIWEGSSLRMWRSYFPNATITGVDRADRGITVDGVTVVICDQDDDSLPGLVGGPFDIVIDDASHLAGPTIASFRNLFPLLRLGGTYVIEDLQTSYNAVDYDGNPDPNGDTPTAMQFCKRLADELNRPHFPPAYRLGYDVSSVQFWPNMCAVTKS